MPRTLTNLTGATTNDKVAALPSLDMSKMGQTDVSADREHHPKVRIAHPNVESHIQMSKGTPCQKKQRIITHRQRNIMTRLRTTTVKPPSIT